jgi:8-oxo-dGTP diphosphatase
MGWSEFRRLVHGYPIPVYALGGMQRSDLENAWHSGAHGVAMVRGAWAGAANARRR